jgi:hypothetical protein
MPPDPSVVVVEVVVPVVSWTVFFAGAATRPMTTRTATAAMTQAST